MNKFNLRAVALWIFVILFLTICPGAEAEVDTVEVSTSDAYMRSFNGSNYLTARNSAMPNNYYTSTLGVGRTGQIYAGGYYVERQFMPFNTSDLGTTAINSVTLHIKLDDDWSATDFDITVCKGLWSSDPPESSAFQIGVGWNINDGGHLTTNGICTPDCWFTVTLDSIQWINKTGITKLVLVSSRDIAATAPTSDEHIEVFSGNAFGDEPFLVIDHTPGGAVKSSLLLKRQQRK